MVSAQSPISNLTPSPAYWYLAQTKPRQEDIALVNVERQQFLVRLPKIFRLRPSPKLPPTRALFPGYIFFAPNSAEQSIAPVRSTLGISRVVRFGVEPALLPNQIWRTFWFLCRIISERRAAYSSTSIVLRWVLRSW